MGYSSSFAFLSSRLKNLTAFDWAASSVFAAWAGVASVGFLLGGSSSEAEVLHRYDGTFGEVPYRRASAGGASVFGASGVYGVEAGAVAVVFSWSGGPRGDFSTRFP